MKTYTNLFNRFCSYENLLPAFKKARKGKTKKVYVIEFEKNLNKNLEELRKELLDKTYFPKPQKEFVIRDPKTRKISKADFKDRIVHHAIVNILEPIFDKTFIHDSCANRKGKGNLFALKRFDRYKREISKNGKLVNSKFGDNYVIGYCLKADIKRYFWEVDQSILLRIIKGKIKDRDLIIVIEKIIMQNGNKGMPLGNLTSQFFANIYLNELDYFIKHKLRAKYYIRYVDDFVILHISKEQLEEWKEQINEFLNKELKLELHKDKSKIIPISKGINFVGFRNFYYFRLLRKRNIKNMINKIILSEKGEIENEKLIESFQGWQAYAKWANSYRFRDNLRKKILSLIV